MSRSSETSGERNTSLLLFCQDLPRHQQHRSPKERLQCVHDRGDEHPPVVADWRRDFPIKIRTADLLFTIFTIIYRPSCHHVPSPQRHNKTEDAHQADSFHDPRDAYDPEGLGKANPNWSKTLGCDMGHGDLKGLWRSMYRDATKSCKKEIGWNDMKWHTFFNLQLWQLQCWTSPWSLTYHWLSSFPCPSLAKNRCYPRQPQNHKTTSKATRCFCSWGIMSKFIISFHQIFGYKNGTSTSRIPTTSMKTCPVFQGEQPACHFGVESCWLSKIYRWSVSIRLFRLMRIPSRCAENMICKMAKAKQGDHNWYRPMPHTRALMKQA